MDEYIEREALRKVMQMATDDPTCPIHIAATVDQYITEAPAADVVPVVRCLECKHHEDEEIGMVYCPNALGGWVRENWFCADGERKEGAD